jgi:hypothetical protein
MTGCFAPTGQTSPSRMPHRPAGAAPIRCGPGWMTDVRRRRERGDETPSRR